MTEKYKENTLSTGKTPSIIREIHVGDLVSLIESQEHKPVKKSAGFVTSIRYEESKSKERTEHSLDYFINLSNRCPVDDIDIKNTEEICVRYIREYKVIERN